MPAGYSLLSWGILLDSLFPTMTDRGGLKDQSLQLLSLMHEGLVSEILKSTRVGNILFGLIRVTFSCIQGVLQIERVGWKDESAGNLLG